MKKYLLLIIFSLLMVTPYAQWKNQEINEQIWKPFIQAFAQNDAALFKSLHSKEVIRVQMNDILDYEKYMVNSENMFQELKKKDEHMIIDFRFIRRLSNDTRAYEEGYFKTSSIQNGKERNFYGRFTVVLIKENGRWKILVDSDTSEGMNEQVFSSGKTME